MTALKTESIRSFNFGIVGPSTTEEKLRFSHVNLATTLGRTDIAPARGACFHCGEEFATCPGHTMLVGIPQDVKYVAPIGLQFVKSILEMICLSSHCVNYCKLKTVHTAPTFILLRNILKKQKCRVCETRSEVRLKKTSCFQYELTTDGTASVFDMVLVMRCFHQFMDTTDKWWDILHVSPTVRDLVTGYIPFIGHRYRMPMIKRVGTGNTQTGNPFTDVVVKALGISSQKDTATRAVTGRSKHELSRETTKMLAQLVSSTNTNRARAPSTQTPMCVTQAMNGKKGHIRRGITGRSIVGMFRQVVAAEGSLTERAVSLSTVHVSLSVSIPFMMFDQVLSCNYDRCKQILESDPTACVRKFVNGTVQTFQRHKVRGAPKLEIGDFLVRRHATGDVVTINRQPTLHKQSIMGHVVSVAEDHKETTVRISAVVTSAYNADYDGDEMNGGSQCSTQAKIETCLIVEVGNCIVKEGTSIPVIGVLYNGILGVYRACKLGGFTLAKRDVDFIRRRVAPRHVSTIDARCAAFGVNPLSMRGVISLALPPWLNYDRSDVKIRNGVLLSGVLTKADVGPTSRGIIHVICAKKGPQPGMDFINQMQMIGEWFTEKFIATIRHEDNLIEGTSVKMIDDMVEYAIKLEPNLEECGELFNLIQMHARDLAKSKIAHNMGDMTNSGAKGSPASIAQNFAPIGNQVGSQEIFPNPLITDDSDTPNMSGDRVRRTTHYDTQSHHPVGYGIVSENFVKGVTFTSMAIFAQSSRAGLVAKTISTATAGTHQRDLARGNESTIAGFNGSITHGTVTIAPNALDGQIGISIKDGNQVDVPFDIPKEMKLLSSTDISLNGNDILLNKKFVVGQTNIRELSDDKISVDLFVEKQFRHNGYASLALAEIMGLHPEKTIVSGNSQASKDVLRKLFFTEKDGEFVFGI